MVINAPVGLLHSREFASTDSLLWLSPKETFEYSTFRSERRRQQWLTGRIAAKFLYLQGGRTAKVQPSLMRISGDMLGRFAAAEYRGAAVLSDQTPAGGPARIDGHKVAISHVNDWACASIGNSGVCALDLEACSSRVPDFYIQNFTARERSWTGDCARTFQLDSDWLYTLLWSAKECLLKTPEFSHLSLWNMPSLEINILSCGERLKALHDANEFRSDFEYLQAEIPAAGRMGLAVSGTTNLVLTALTRLDN